MSVIHENARQAAITWAQEILEDPGRLVIFDTETTGVDRGAEIVEIGVVNGYGDILLDSLVQPVDPIPGGAQAVHGISNEDVENAPCWPEIYIDLKPIFDAHPIVVVYNLDFDVRMLNQSSEKWNLAEFRYPRYKLLYQWDCAMLKYAEFAGEVHEFRQSYKWHRLGAAIESFGIVIPENAHRALDDARSTLKLIRAMAEEG